MPRRVPALLTAGAVAIAGLSTVAAKKDNDLQVGFGARVITPVGEVPAEWTDFFTPHPETGVWGEPYTDLDGDGCYSGLTNDDLEPVLDGEAPSGALPEPFVDDPWNSMGDAYETGFFGVRGVQIIGDPDSTGKWDGVWGNAGFGATCALGMHDDTWARASVLELDGHTVAMVSLDVVGWFNIEVQRTRTELVARYPEMEIDELVVSATHTHEGVDTMGYWGQLFAATDGKFPAYQAFIRSQTIDAIHDAWEAREASKVKFAVGESPMRIRDSRPPEVVDDVVPVAQFIAKKGNRTLGTIVNWSNHPEAQGSNNPYVSSDFPHATREVLEAELGGTAVYMTGAVGGLQTPLGVDIPGFGSQVSWERTWEIGRLVAESAIDALKGAKAVKIDTLTSRRRVFYFDSDNNVLRALNATGIFDFPTYIGGQSWGDEEFHQDGFRVEELGPQGRTEMVVVELGPAMFLTVPGELSPDIELGGYGRPDCPGADTGRPYEPVINQQFDHEYQFVLGLGQDELGYIIPGYDFHITEAPQTLPEQGGAPAELTENTPGIVPLGGLETETCGEGHYEETVSISSVFAPWVACIAKELAGKDPWTQDDPDNAACAQDNMTTNPYGIRTDWFTGPAGMQAMREAIERSHGHSHLPPEQVTSPDSAEGSSHAHGGVTHQH